MYDSHSGEPGNEATFRSDVMCSSTTSWTTWEEEKLCYQLDNTGGGKALLPAGQHRRRKSSVTSWTAWEEEKLSYQLDSMGGGKVTSCVQAHSIPLLGDCTSELDLVYQENQ